MKGIMNICKAMILALLLAMVFPFTQSTIAQSKDNKLLDKVTEVISSRYYADNVNVSLKNDGWITLTGQVKLLYDKDRIFEIAAHVPGVKKITNDIDVTASTTPGNTNAAELPDDEIAQNILYSYKLSALIEQPQDIKVTVDNHLAILSGSVDFLREKMVAETLASQVLGVEAIQNDIKVAPVNNAFSDADIKTALESVLRDEFPLVDSKDINIVVDNGFVTITGTVSSLWEKDSIENEFSTIGGVSGVFNKLEVKPEMNS
jgi:osmotically-inducible protein OsmY